MKQLITCISATLIMLTGCGGSSGGDDGDEGNISNNVTQPENDTSGMTNPTTVADASSIVGLWVRCMSSGPSGQSFAFARRYSATEFVSYGKDFDVPNCVGPFNLEDSTQSGTYELVGTDFSASGLAVEQIRHTGTNGFGGTPLPAPDFFSTAHRVENTLYMSLSDLNLDGGPRALQLEAPYVLRDANNSNGNQQISAPVFTQSSSEFDIVNSSWLSCASIQGTSIGNAFTFGQSEFTNTVSNWVSTDDCSGPPTSELITTGTYTIGNAITSEGGLNVRELDLQGTEFNGSPFPFTRLTIGHINDGGLLFLGDPNLDGDVVRETRLSFDLGYMRQP